MSLRIGICKGKLYVCFYKWFYLVFNRDKVVGNIFLNNNKFIFNIF